MEANTEFLTESAIETEDMFMSEEETSENEKQDDIIQLNIDCNNRLTSDASFFNSNSNSDINFCEKENNSSDFYSWKEDSFADVSYEDFEFSDEDDSSSSKKTFAENKSG
ncbi:hypothetical protein CEXT_163131 [Caerostris extrusa]|uniref:Uncharacterized protein n=1 Tax=Caerostris extrusa TaxID=172846 RepID=A0AAV4Y9R0_CAEEX|nr:hypothetical protein CEXT_163131 [Caerostris extrusa]